MCVDLPNRFANVAELGEALIPFAGAPVAPFRSHPSAPPVADSSDQTLASGAERNNSETASTTAPLTPKTRGSIPLDRGPSKTKRYVALGGVLTLIVGAFAWLRDSPQAQRVSPAVSTENSVTAAAPVRSVANAAPAAVSAGPSVSEHLDRPDSGVSRANAANSLASASTKPAARAPVAARLAKEPEKAPTHPAISAPPPVLPPAPAPVATAVPRTIEISRDPNF